MDEWGVDRVEIVKETYLSRKPAPGSAYIALGSVVLLFAATLLYWNDAFGSATLFPASRESVFSHGEYWRLGTSMLVHADFGHLLSNSVVLGVLAFLVFGYFGPAIYPGWSIPLGALVTGVSLSTYPSQTLLLGASGLV